MLNCDFKYRVTTKNGIRQFPDSGSEGTTTKVICTSNVANYLVGWIPTDLKCMMSEGDHFNSLGMKYEVTQVDGLIKVKLIK